MHDDDVLLLTSLKFCRAVHSWFGEMLIYLFLQKLRPSSSIGIDECVELVKPGKLNSSFGVLTENSLNLILKSC